MPRKNTVQELISLPRGKLAHIHIDTIQPLKLPEASSGVLRSTRQVNYWMHAVHAVHSMVANPHMQLLHW